jgi:adiponectin receptor
MDSGMIVILTKRDRRVSNSVLSSLGSLLYLNNQTVNVYSHIAGAALFLSFPHRMSKDTLSSELLAQDPNLSTVKVYCYSVVVCFSCSAM